MNEEKNRLTTIDTNGNVFIWDTDSMDQLVKIPAPLDSDGKPEECISANADEKSVYVCYRNRLVKYDYSGNSLSDYSVDFNISACDFHTGSSQAAFCGENKVCVLDLSNLSEIFSTACDTSVYDGFFGDIIYSPDYEFLCVAQSSYGFGNATTLVALMDTKTGEIANAEVPGEYINKFNITKNGNLAILYSEGIYRGDIQNAKFLAVYSKDGKNLWTEKLAANYHVFQIAYELLDSSSFTKDDTEYNLIVASTQYDTFTYDEFTGELITAFSHPAPICSQYVSRARTTGYLLFLDGSISIVDFTTGQYYSEYEFRCNFSPNMMQVGTRQADGQPRVEVGHGEAAFEVDDVGLLIVGEELAALGVDFPENLFGFHTAVGEKDDVPQLAVLVHGSFHDFVHAEGQAGAGGHHIAHDERGLGGEVYLFVSFLCDVP